jgi:NADPH-dependent glutamate synthase beta subunit-like oxidoreductase
MSKAIIFKSAKEMPTMAVSLADMSFNRTGSWRYLRPIYQEKLAPCRGACPAGNDLPHTLALIAEGRLVEAWKLFRETNPLPGVCGRICYHPCETVCNRKDYDEAISIAALERRAADACFDLKGEATSVERRKERVAIIGSGPAGLSCADVLARSGYPVAIFEAAGELGGMLRLGIPQYRLPREVLNKEIEDTARMGVEFEVKTRVGEDLPLERIWQRYDAVFIAVGAHRSRLLQIPGEDDASVLTGLDFLKATNAGQSVNLGQTVLVIGGGNTAIDAARTALRFNAHPLIVYRRSRAEMPAVPEEIEEAEHEGVQFIFQAAPQAIRRADGVLEVAFIRMRLEEVAGLPSESRRRQPIPIPGSEFVLNADAVLKALGEEPELSFVTERMETSAGIVTNNPQGLLQRAGIFIGGDARTGPSSVVQAIASGKETARMIERYLQKEHKPKQAKKLEEADFERLHLDYFAHQSRAQTSTLPVGKRLGNFSEIQAPLSENFARTEAQRCFSCGVCNLCDNCRVFCPDVAISRSNGTYEVDLEYCKGCGVCAQECPRGVISLREEER